MAALVYKLMACLLLLQAVSGWCCHRPCPNDGSCAPSANSVSTKACGHKHRKCQEEKAPESPEAPCEHDDCQGYCQYVAPPQLEIDLSQILLTPHFLLAGTPAVDLVKASTACEQLAADEGATLARPLRLHLWNQLLLI